MANGPEVAKAYVTIIPSMEGSQNTIAKELGATVDDAGKKAGAGFGTALKGGMAVAGASIAAVGAAAVKMGTDFIGGAKDVAVYGDNIDKMSQKMGLSAEKYQEWDFIMQHSGTSMETMKASMKTLANAVESGNVAFDKIGLSMEDLSTMSQEDIFEATIAGLQGVSDTTERTYLAGKLLGRGATELGALLNTSAEDVQKMKDDIHALGGVMSDEAVKASAAFQDSLQNLNVSLDGIKNKAMAEFLPSMVSVMDGLSLVFSGQNGGLGKISEGIDGIISGITKALPKLSKIGITIIDSIGTSIIANAPAIMDSAVTVVMTLGDMIISNLPMLLEVAGDMILSIANGLSQNLPTLIPTIVDVMMQITNSLIDNIDLLVDATIEIMLALSDGLIEALPILIDKAPEIIIKLVDALVKNGPKLLQAGVDLIVKLGEGLIKAIPQLTSKLPQIATALVNGFKGLAGQFVSIGANIVTGIWDGLRNNWGQIINWIKGVASDLVNTVKSFFGIHSPSTVFRDQIGKNLALGLGEGFVDEMDSVNKQIEGSLQTEYQIATSYQPSMASAVSIPTQSDNESLSDKMDKLIELLSNQKIVLDSGVLVGATAPMMNSELGRLQLRGAY